MFDKRWLIWGFVCLFWLPTASVAQSLLDQLEGSFGHAPAPSGLSALEGDYGHAAPSLEDGISCAEGRPCVEEATQLPLRVLPRPFSHVYRQPSADADGIVIANVPSFHPLYVFDRRDLDLRDPANPKGWYQVGATQADANGWMSAQDVLEWRQALLVSYTHPGGLTEGRNPVLMFRDYQGSGGSARRLRHGRSGPRALSRHRHGGSPGRVGEHGAEALRGHHAPVLRAANPAVGTDADRWR
jgi:serine/threonine-protein kinase PpkA